jgi:pimeloyl-ACP methyl ester carboxylesterase
LANHLFELDNGRNVGVSSAGDPIALRLVVFCHPTPGAGGFDPDPVVTSQWGVHLLSVDRPGYGASDPLGDDEPRTFAARADDIAAFIRYSSSVAHQTSGTDFGRIGVVGWQSGGWVALALAARHPEIVDRLAIVDTPMPPDHAPDLRQPPFGLDMLGIDSDDPVLGRPGVENRLNRMLEQAAVHGDSGLQADLASMGTEDHPDASLTKASFDGLSAAAKLIYGEGRVQTSPDDGHWYQHLVPKADVVRVQNGGSLSIVTQWEKILAHVAPDHGELEKLEGQSSDSDSDSDSDG